MEEKDILKTLKEYPQGVERYEDDFRIICNSVYINEFCFRNASTIKLCCGTLWIDGVSIDIKDIRKFQINKIRELQHKEYEIKMMVNE